VLGKTEQLRWGGDLRRASIFQSLVDRTGATASARWDRRTLWQEIRRAHPGLVLWPRPWLASGELLADDALLTARWLSRPIALDVHDEPVIQAAALGRPFEPARAAALTSRFTKNLALFPVHVVPSASFASLIGLEVDQVIVAPNGANTAHVRPGPFPARPTIGLVSAAAPNRGIEAIIAAATALRTSHPDLELRLWLAGTDRLGLEYIERLRTDTGQRPWIQIGTVPYDQLGTALADATILVVPQPASDYADVAVPVKLADSMAAGRPVVVTPRREAARIVREAGCGVVADGDDADALAAAIDPLLDDQALIAQLGQRARESAVRDYDWRVISDRVADAVVARVGSG